jgi:hypothetical protein
VQLTPLSDRVLPLLYSIAAGRISWSRINSHGHPNFVEFQRLIWQNVYIQYQAVDHLGELCAVVAIWNADLINRTAWFDVLAVDGVPLATVRSSISLALDFVFENSPFRKVYYEHVACEPNEMAVFDRLAILEGLLQNDYLAWGQYWDRELYAIYKDDWHSGTRTVA